MTKRIKNEFTAVAYLQGALHSLELAKATGNDSRELAIAFTNIETALLWLEKDVEFKKDGTAKPLYLQKRQPYIPPESYDVEQLKVLTVQERVGMFGYDPLGGEQV